MSKFKILSKHTVAQLVKIYYDEREEDLKTNTDFCGHWESNNYWANFTLKHLDEIKNFTTLTEIDNDLQSYFNMTFKEWYEDRYL